MENKENRKITGLIRPFFVILLVVLVPGVAFGVRPVQASSPFLPHSPIIIAGSGAFIQSNGVTAGSGTSSDPFIISGWRIDASSSNGIVIRDTDPSTYFVIRNVFIDSASDSNAAVVLENISGDGTGFEEPNNIFNGVVANSTLSDDAHGVVLDSARNVKVQGLNVRDSGSAVECMNYAIFNMVRDNRVVDSNYGARLDGCLYMDLFSNTLSNVKFGIFETAIGASGIDAEHNIIRSPMGITVNHSHSGIFASNLISWGQETGGSLFQYGVRIIGSCCISIDGNTITNTGPTDFASTPGGVVISAGCGCDNAIIGNTIAVGDAYGVALLAGAAGPALFNEANIVFHNNFLNNKVQALDQNPGPGLNKWDNGYPRGGNFWSDYPGVDNCSGPLQNICPSPDGIGDTPYAFSFNRDNYPLIQPFTE